MRRLVPGFHASWNDADLAFASFIEALPVRREQLRARLAETCGPELDGSFESLDALNEWYIRIAFADEDDGTDWWPMWHQRRDEPLATTRWHRGAPPRLLRLWELVAVYVGDLSLARDDRNWQKAPSGRGAGTRVAMRPW
ncbi:hypothetical protein Lsed01_00044 [Demequina sediminis]|uniref:Uncharacterized protein n=1 Tax=Demequina sediminis TaxID=1930058 RepID=A0ABP9WG95_9MICO|nr:hypothetical protein [Demequina sediminis]BDZ60703.1 hypothetical protein GCM10025873_04940 [Demequina sediminis]